MLRSLLALVLWIPAIFAYPEEVVLEWQLPTTRVDGSRITEDQYRGANVYCGPKSRTYDELTTWPGVANRATVQIQQAPKYCTVTLLIAQAPDVAGDPERIDEGAYSSNEVRLAQAIANGPILMRATYKSAPRICTTTCVLDPPITGSGPR